MQKIFKSPYVNALCATLYIVCVVLFFQNAEKIFSDSEMLAGMIVLSLFVFSAALMGFLFLSQPIQLYLDGDKKQAVRFFGQTLGTFGIFTLLLAIVQIILGRV